MVDLEMVKAGIGEVSCDDNTGGVGKGLNVKRSLIMAEEGQKMKKRGGLEFGGIAL